MFEKMNLKALPINVFKAKEGVCDSDGRDRETIIWKERDRINFAHRWGNDLDLHVRLSVDTKLLKRIVEILC